MEIFHQLLEQQEDLLCQRWASSDHQAPEILSIFGPGCIVSDIFEINVSTNIDNIIHTPKIKDIIWNGDYDILQTRYSAKRNRKEYAQCQIKRNLQYTPEV